MAKAKALELTIAINGRVDKSLSEAVTAAQKQVNGLFSASSITKSVQDFSKLIGSVGRAGLAATGAVTAGIAAGLAQCTAEAADFESGMTKVYKYVNGLADETGKIASSLIYTGAEVKGTIFDGNTYAENVDTVRKAILDLSAQVPLTISEIQDMYAKLGQSGVGLGDLVSYDSSGGVSGYVKDAAMIAAAFDMEASSIADMMMQAENAFGYTHDQVLELFDAINYTAANSPTTASELVETVFRTLAMGEISGMGATGTVALADALLASGIESSKAATTTKNMLTYLSLGDAATSSQQAAFAKLGLTASDVAAGMQENGIGTLNDLFGRIRGLEKDEQISALKSIFNMRAIEGGSMIANNPELLMNAVALAATTEGSRGYNSIAREFGVETASPEAVSQMLQNAVSATKTELGISWSDIRTEGMRRLLELVIKIRENLPDLSQLAEKIIPVMNEAFDRLSAQVDVWMPKISSFFSWLAENPGEAIEKVVSLVKKLALMSVAPQIANLAGGAANMIGGTADFASALLGSRSATVKDAAYYRQQAARKKQLAGMKSGAKSYFTGLPGLLTGFGSSAANLSSVTGLTGFLGENYIEPWKEIGAFALDSFTSIPQVSGFLGTARGVYGGVSGKISAGKGLLSQLAGSALGGISPVAGAALEAGHAGADLLGGIWSPFAKGFTGLLGKSLPVVGGISAAIAAVSLLRDNLDGVGNVITGLFGEEAGAAFDSLREKALGFSRIFEDGGLRTALQGVTDMITGMFGEDAGAAFEGVLDRAQPFVTGIGNAVKALPGLTQDGGLAAATAGIRARITDAFGEDAGAAFGGIVQMAQPLLTTLGQIAGFAEEKVKPIFSWIGANIMPIILQSITAAAPVISGILSNLGSAVVTVAGIIADAITALQPVIEVVMSFLGTTMLPFVLGVLESFSAGILQFVQGAQDVLNGIITFVTGVFQGNWAAAWEGVKQAFGGAFSALVGLAKAPINAVIGLVNTAIDGINGLIAGALGNSLVQKAADFTGIDTDAVRLPHIPQLAAGGFTSGASIAGEAGTEAVISFDPAYRRENLDTWLKAGQMLAGGRTAVSLADTGGIGSAGESTTVYFSPNITISGNADKAVVKQALKEAQSEFEDMYEKMMRRKARVSYA